MTAKKAGEGGGTGSATGTGSRRPSDAAWLLCLGLCFAGFLLSWAIWAPGFMSPDSHHQWSQVKSGEYVDDHPTIMVLLWRAIRLFHDGPTGLFFLHLSVFWLALMSLSRLLGPRGGAWPFAALMVGFAPPVFGSLGAIWKDIGLGIALLAALALTGRLYQRFSWRHLALAAMLLFYAQNVRHNAPPAVLPFWIALALVVLRHLGRPASPWRVGFAGVAMLAVASIGYKSFETVVLRPEKTYFVQNLMLHDLAALSTAKGELLIPEPHRGQDCTVASVAETYRGDGRCYDTFFYGKNALQRVPTGEATESLRRIWWREVRARPGVYLKHRWRFFVGTLGWGQGPCRAHQILHLPTPPPSPGIGVSPVRAAQWSFLHFEKWGLFFEPWFYLAASSLLFALGLKLEDGVGRAVMLTASSSSVLYLLPYFFVTVCCDFRYSWWAALSSLMAGLFYLSSRPWARGRAR